MENEDKNIDRTEQVVDSKIDFNQLGAKPKASKFDRITTVILLIICIGLAAFIIFGSV